ncbi:hypothetical protein GGI15_002247 [Coemansia interrupta]|uniref:Uncharacterized protein n=1 Tax=Coemansia interrupta TaxID=1126814 RepID=A0A9W8HMH6_9FUNG|nr:hypothetical protein GGI15_002247 [Coemansia interrupta]
MSLGVYSVISCHIFRIYQYHCIFRWRIRASGRYLWIPIALWALFPLVYGILASALPEDKGTLMVADPPMCFAHKPAYFVALSFLLVLILCWIYATLLMNRVNVCFNEYRELIIVIVSTILVVLIQVVLRWVPAVGDSGFAYNTMTSMTDILIGQVSFLVLVSKPAFHCLYDRDAYLKVFLQTLKKENRHSEYELANGEEIGRISSSYNPEDSHHYSSASVTGSTSRATDDSVTAFHDDLGMSAVPKRMLV